MCGEICSSARQPIPAIRPALSPPLRPATATPIPNASAPTVAAAQGLIDMDLRWDGYQLPYRAAHPFPPHLLGKPDEWAGKARVCVHRLIKEIYFVCCRTSPRLHPRSAPVCPSGKGPMLPLRLVRHGKRRCSRGSSRPLDGGDDGLCPLRGLLRCTVLRHYFPQSSALLHRRHLAS